jgi:mevalonate kinase
VERNRHGRIKITLSDFGGASIELNSNELGEIFKRYKNRKSLKKYIAENSDINQDLLPYVTIASRLYKEFGIDVLGKSATISSELPPRAGIASSAACNTAFTVSLLGQKPKMNNAQIIDAARDGERIVHKNEGAGKIDVSTSYYGGCVSYVSTKSRKHKLNSQLSLLIVNTGPKKSTAETVGHVASLYKSKRAFTEGILKQINKCAISGLSAIKEGDKEELGRCMLLDHELLKKLEVSSVKLDKVVEISKRYGALGAKLSGGGGGGAAVVLLDAHQVRSRFLDELKRSNFEIVKTGITTKGASYFINS